ncbi:hypothetical protein JF781_24215 [Mycobacterium sp. WUMAC-067]|uniref:hypothetical protein n=1 Tax=unclassified Mycobacterium TaxID=2642494 RepID=UPI001CD94B85|nr:MULTISPECIES: hypothetical protein [unclassified Mycobacterium]MCA2245451.1 hypothetical protein [Mycobacterium sp. WUMAC-067]MCA2316991.1 hypothetical protein [Mycobacterium sp. WUMAC-025]
MSCDTVIRQDRWLDPTGAPSGIRNIGIRDRRVTVFADGRPTQVLDTRWARNFLRADGRPRNLASPCERSTQPSATTV